MDIETSLWVEKYRPKKIEDVVLPESYMSDFKTCIERGGINNFVFYGRPGSGKTCVAMILSSENGVIKKKDNVLCVNGSGQQTRGIGYVESVIEPYLKIPPLPPDKQKIIFIDESDGLTEQAFNSLRAIIEKYEKYARFLFTCNYISKIPEFLLSRLQPYEFKQIPKEFVLKYCENVLINENIKYEKEQVEYLIETLYPDIRRILNALHKNSMSGSLRFENKDILTNENHIMTSVMNIIEGIRSGNENDISNNVSNIIGFVEEIDVDFKKIYTELFYNPDLPIPVKIPINRYLNTHTQSLVPSMHFMSCIFEIIKVLQSLKNLKR